MLMSKDEVTAAVQVWPANEPAPIARDQQIELMTTAAERHRDLINRLKNKDSTL